MRCVLGIHGFSAHNRRHLHDTGVALVRDGEVVAAINEERLSRDKNDGQFPRRSYRQILKMTGTEPGQIDMIVMPDERPSWQIVHIMKYVLKAYKETGILPHRYLIDSFIRTLDFRRLPPKELRPGAVKFVEHHLAHAASAYYAGPWSRCTVITLDGMGDYCMGGSVSVGSNGKLKVLKRTNGFYSPGIFYMIVTDCLGFKPGRHEGKVTGLAAYGDPSRCYHAMEDIISYRKGQLDFHSVPIIDAIDECSFTKGKKGELSYFKHVWDGHTKQDIAAAAQRRLEDVVISFVNDCLDLTREKNLVLAGGIFANVKLNQRIMGLSRVKNVYIHPSMTDAGLATGAALYAYYNCLDSRSSYEPHFMSTVYLGPEYDDSDIEKSLRRFSLGFHKKANTEEEIAKAIHEGAIVGHYHGRMEYGPRALGNRSILASPTDPDINTRLNARLKRTEFMPFAPSILEDYADRYLVNWASDHVASRFMTITYEVSPEFVEKAPAAVHVDNSARPHVVRKCDNPRFYSIIRHYFDLSGIPLVINTSFNMHEEPIVCTPRDAIRAFNEGAVDILVMNDFWVAKEAHE